MAYAFGVGVTELQMHCSPVLKTWEQALQSGTVWGKTMCTRVWGLSQIHRLGEVRPQSQVPEPNAYRNRIGSEHQQYLATKRKILLPLHVAKQSLKIQP